MSSFIINYELPQRTNLSNVAGSVVTYILRTPQLVKDLAGITGATGYTGPAGFSTNTGATGTTGYTGPRGNTGAPGTAGFSTNTGATGSTGPQGNTGAPGTAGFSTNTGATGSTGPQGNTGPRGDIGYTGATGAISNNPTFINVNISNNLTSTNAYISSLSVNRITGVNGYLNVLNSDTINTNIILSNSISYNYISGNNIYVNNLSGNTGYFNYISASALKYTGGEVIINDSSGPIINQSLIATSNNNAVWNNKISCYIYDNKIPGTNGGDFISGSWITRTLNSITGSANYNNFISITGNAGFILQPSFYKINVSCPAYKVNSHKSRLQNITNNTTLAIGSSEVTTSNVSSCQTKSNILCIINITSPIIIEVQHQCITSFTVSGLGLASGFGVNEIYTQVNIEIL